MTAVYVFSYFDAEGRKVASGPAEAVGDVRAVVAAIKALGEQPQYDAVEVARGGRLLRRITRSEVAPSAPS